MANQPLINLQEKRDIGQVLNTTFAFIRLTYKYLYKDLLLLGAPFFILYGLLVSYAQMNVYSGGIGNGLVMYTMPMYYVAILFLIIGWTISTSLIGNYVLHYKINGNTDFNVREIRRAVGRDFFRLFGAFLLYYLVMIVGYVMLIIPGIYITVAYSLLSTGVVQDKENSIGHAFSESARLISDNWWCSLGLGIIVALIIYAFTFVFGLPNMIYTFIIAMHRMSGDVESYTLPVIIFGVIAHLAYCLTAPISVVASIVYYYSLKEEKDQVGLLERIDELGANENIVDLNETT